MTIKLYDNDAYQKEFEAVVRECSQSADGKYCVLLDQTCFFPLEGGQSPDKGTINQIPVNDVKIKDDEIIHILDEPLEKGTVVKGIIDWEHRFSNMQMHSGEHIFSGFANRLYGFNNVGFHLSDNTATMDYDGKLTKEDVEKLELLANKAIWEGHEIKTYFPEPEVLEKLDYRSKSGITGKVRMVEIEGVDLCACCAPHVRNTTEVGILKIVSFENYKGGTRLNYLCGQRAFLDYKRLNENEIGLSRELNVKREDILEGVNKLKNSYESLKYSFTSLRRENVAKLCFESNESFLFLDIEDSDQLRFAVSELRKKFNTICCVFAGNDADGYRYILEVDGRDLSEINNELRIRFGAKGGGKNGSIQGSLSAKGDELKEFIKSII